VADRVTLREHERSAVIALALITFITASWWALALWPLSSEAPNWLVRTKFVCFGRTADGLPDASGWTALVLQPLLMYAALVGIWGRSVVTGLAHGWGVALGRAGIVGTAVVLVTSVFLATVRVVNAIAQTGTDVFEVTDSVVPATYPRLDRVAPEIDLVDQYGTVLNLDNLGRPALVTFAFAHCVTICPLVVRDALRAQRELASDNHRVAVVVITLDPWRDVPSRLAAIAEKWRLEEDGYVVSGEVDTVQAVLAAWNVPWQRNERTGDIVHPRLTYVVDGAGTIAYGASGSASQVAELMRRAIRSPR
jgi:cytochrome oxidase Cu insertion factor (SCO1/SenC/PrrC family)